MLKIYPPAIAIFISDCNSSSLKSAKCTKKKKKKDDSIAVITHATILFIQIIIENIHDPPGNTAKLVVYADDFSALSTVTELNVLW